MYFFLTIRCAKITDSENMAILSLRSSILADARRKFRKGTYAFAIALLVKVAPKTFITLRAVFFYRFPY
jgi:hypothetical protein